MSVTPEQRALFGEGNAFVTRLEGGGGPLVLAPPFTPFAGDGSVDEAAMASMASRAAADGFVDAAFLNGTAGEGESLTRAERCRAVEAWRQNAPALPLVVNCSAAALEDARAMAAHAEEAGAAAVSCSAPAFFAPRDPTALVAYVRRVAEAAPRTPFVYYHYPGRTGCPVPLHAFLAAAAGEIPTLVGAKFTDTSVGDLAHSLAACGRRFFVFAGPATASMPAALMGGHGAFIYPFLAPLLRVVLDGSDGAGRDTDRREAFELLLRAERVLSAQGCTNPTAKAVESVVWGPQYDGLPRAPLTGPADPQAAIEALRRLVADAPFEFEAFRLR